MSLRVHALEGAMVSTEKGVSKLLTVYSQGAEDTQVFVLSPVRNPELSFDKLLSAAEAHEASLWTRLEKNHHVWKELVASNISSEKEAVVASEIDGAFEEVRDVLKAVWILGDKSGAAPDHLEALTSKFLAKILSARFNDEGAAAAVYSPET
ncbi:MAG: hypothetical protein KBS81_10055, partial [Spirochaetales bacterium]|nr:hypothetical protein [Candidatus Physcosoma equi]